MRLRRRSQLVFTLFAALASATATQIHAFKDAPARPATAAPQIAKEAQQEAHAPAESPEAHANRSLNDARGNAGALYAWLKDMPKGGDLHNHITGAVYAESLIRFAAQSGLCLDSKTMALSPAPCKPEQRQAADAMKDPLLYRQVIDAWSMRDLPPAESGHDHFFDTFPLFDPATHEHMPEILTEVVERAADGNVQYLELMATPDYGRSLALGSTAGWDEDFGKMRQKLVDGGLQQAVEDARKALDTWEHGKDSALRCPASADRANQNGPCGVTVRYIYPVLRAFTPEQVFAQTVLAFELAHRDKRVVGVNMVQPEDWQVPMRDFRLHMRMIAFFKQMYPEVHVSLHAGELRPGIVPPDGLRYHIRESIEVGKAERIGHGVAVMYEENAQELLNIMARKNVMVEICLTSNEGILGVRGRHHPLTMYLKAGVPVALATDDEGVSRSEMTREYERAVLDQNLDYSTLKRMARTSLEHAFLPGASLWSDPHRFVPVHECANDKFASATPSPSCARVLNASEKAREQWRLEHRFAQFELKVEAER